MRVDLKLVISAPYVFRASFFLIRGLTYSSFYFRYFNILLLVCGFRVLF